MESNPSIQAAPVIASTVHDPVKRIQIPPNLRVGDTFIVNPEDGPPFTVVVPEGAPPGSFINIVVPLQANILASDGDSSNQKVVLEIDKSVVGAAVFGAIVGTVLIGPVVGMALAGGVAYVAHNKKDSNSGKEIRKIGNATYKGIADAKNWAVKNLKM